MSAGFRAVLVVGWVLTFTSAAMATTYIVNPYGTGDFPTIQAAIDAASAGDIILLIDGVYTGYGNRDLDYHGKAITIQSQSDNPVDCVIDCQGSESDPHRGFYFHTDEAGNSLLRGVTITNGYMSRGGGIHCGSSTEPSIRNCIITSNVSGGGAGGMHCSNAGSIYLADCQFLDNTGHAMSGAGGLFADETPIRIENCTFQGNSGSGGAAGAAGSTNNGWYFRFTDCTFSQNTSTYRGGAIRLDDAPLECTNCVVSGNTAQDGGAIDASTRENVTLTDCILIDNVATGSGGAIFEAGTGPIVLTNCTLVGNSAPVRGGLHLSIGPTILENTIIAYCTEGEAIGGSDLATLSCCDVYGNAGGDYVGPIAGQLGINGNISEPPLFCDPSNDNYALHQDSPCAPFSPPNTECDLIGALPVGCGLAQRVCCIDETCQIMTHEACITSAGEWHPELESCSPNPCIFPHVCCFANGTCSVVYETECTDPDAFWHPEWDSCDPNPCPQPAVCCVGEECHLVPEVVCTGLGGEWFSELGSCDPDPCGLIFTYYFSEGLSAARGDTLTVVVNGRNDAPLWGYAINFLFDPQVFECTGMTVDGTRGEDPWGDPPASTCGADDARIGVVYSFSCPPQIEPGDGAFLKVFLCVKLDAPLGPTVLDLADAPPTFNRMSLCNTETAYPDLIDGVAVIDTMSSAIEMPEGDGVDVDGSLRILELRPNPTTGGSEIIYQVPLSGPVNVEIYDLSGRMVLIRRVEDLNAGVHRLAWDGRDAQGHDAGAGSYFVRILQGKLRSGQRLLLIR
ncbi:right-handed parallel beta-helix repeat-containing protein [Candidatus Eisenbacteria bacterium]|uniref:Right-handed parallel beta-helix repeat-containing protein n=1 Tax=Eiseniibacteriota bacterium TaxID=2212470 RepID=A0ABV6YKW5_UNCEI